MTTKIKIGIVAGEASGDILGAALIKSLKHRLPHVEFSGIGGPRMLAEGFHSYFPQDRLAVMGLVEPLKRLPELLRIRRFLIEHFSDNPPALFIGIDSPDFNLTLEEKLKATGITTAHYVSPSVWAWRQGRIKKIKRAVDLMLALLPFESEFYRKHDVPVQFIGHHLADEIPLESDQQQARSSLQLAENDEIIALLPGSRQSEVDRLGPIFFAAARLCLARRPELKFVVAAANAERYRQIYQQLSAFTDLPIQLVQGKSQQVMMAADAVILASGTTALEAMLLKKPMVVSYKAAWLTFKIIWSMLKVPYVALPNLLAGRELVPELLQENATPDAIANAVLPFFDDRQLVDGLRESFLELHQQLRLGASERAADALLDLIENAELEPVANG
ncbi:MAG TPA: lipid-A-disaccharide synthase [Cellvibrionaceae bacterium]